GYPLGDPEYTLTRGIVSKVSAGGETQWASVDSVLEHDAPGQPGNSGGPVVTADGDVVGIHYAGGGAGTNTEQYFAIDAEEARGIVSTLSAGSDVESLGINGQTVTSDDGSVYGLWVAGVTSGSPADSLELQPGDIVTRLEGVSIGADGTMADYCDVLRTHDSSDALAVEVLRYSTEEVLSGEFNGSPLETSFSFAEELDETSLEEGDADSGTAAYEYVVVTDATGLLTVSIPTAWSDIDGAAEQTDSGEAPTIRASTDLEAYQTTWNVPGIYFAASGELGSADPNVLLDSFAPPDCTSTGREDYADAVFTGLFEAFEDCGGTGTQVLNVVAFPTDAAYAVVVSVQVVTDADLEAVDTILRTFNTTEG
ncbi:MAG: S1C family serine protease, partial [Ilumatobacter sp.]